uniref:Uncharacterized protein n=1 Tax=Neovison vison TaxID=452646 RepID=A0A8C7B4C6_NEOVI
MAAAAPRYSAEVAAVEQKMRRPPLHRALLVCPRPRCPGPLCLPRRPTPVRCVVPS